MAEYQVSDKSIILGTPVFHFLKTERNSHDRYNPQPAQ
jgi:hypothetical protein